MTGVQTCALPISDSAIIEQPDVSGENTEDEKEEDDGSADQ